MTPAPPQKKTHTHTTTTTNHTNSQSCTFTFNPTQPLQSVHQGHLQRTRVDPSATPLPLPSLLRNRRGCKTETKCSKNEISQTPSPYPTPIHHPSTHPPTPATAWYWHPSTQIKSSRALAGVCVFFLLVAQCLVGLVVVVVSWYTLLELS